MQPRILSLLFQNSKRKLCFRYFLTSRKLSSFALKYEEHGEPEKVLEKIEVKLNEELESNHILVKMLAAPINPADINMIQGKYAVKPKLPAIGGNEGVGEVVKVGPSVTKFCVGSRVMPFSSGWGTWKTYAVSPEDHFLEIDKTLPLVSAATFSVNPCTAWRMLKDFVNLKSGDTVIQNGANSAVGQAVIQIAKHLGIHSINVVRDRPDIEALKQQLTSLGATHVVTENELRTLLMEDIFRNIPKPSLALNCVGGKSVAELIRHIQNKGTIVTYGGMSKLPLTINTSSFIFNDIRMRGFWMTHWNREKSLAEKNKMISEITSLIHKQVLRPPKHRKVPFDDFRTAITRTMEGFANEKQILIMNE